jgi:hypothetical protein
MRERGDFSNFGEAYLFLHCDLVKTCKGLQMICCESVVL